MPRKKTTAEFIEDAKKVHGDRYDYSEVVYVNGRSKVRIGCKKHGMFEQSPESHLAGCGCRSCGLEASGAIRLMSVDEFESKARRVHGDRYDYSEVVYKGNKKKVSIICKKHGVFEQSPALHLGGCGCWICGLDSKTGLSSKNSLKAASEFESKARHVHGNIYDYSQAIYASSMSKVNIICKIHGVFEQAPSCHLSGHGCPRCGAELASKFQLIRSARAGEEFESKAKQIHGDKYDYSEVTYVNNRAKVRIRCKEHGVFEQKPNGHLNGKGCPICARRSTLQSNSSRASIAGSEFKSKARRVHGDKYDYSEVVYVSCMLKVRIVCKKHGVFEQSPNAHLRGGGCSSCNTSQMERIAAAVLGDLKIEFGKDIALFNRKRFDVAIPVMSQLWEFDGEQHFMPVEIWGGEEAFIKSVHRDAEKTRWAVENNWTLIRVPYWDQDNIESYIRECTATPPPPGLIITSHSNGEHSYDKMLEAAKIQNLPCMASSR